MTEGLFRTINTHMVDTNHFGKYKKAGKWAFPVFPSNMSLIGSVPTPYIFDDILAHIRDWQICASLDGTEQIGEYIRTGLDYAQFCRNFEHGLKYATNPRQMRLDFTLTLPGMFETGAMEKLSQTYGVQLLAKVIFSFSPDIVMSPLALPRHLLDPWVDELAGRSAGDMRDVLLQLKNRPCFEEQWPDTYRAGLAKGKARVLQLESIRTQKITMAEILAQRPAVLEWWNKIA